MAVIVTLLLVGMACILVRLYVIQVTRHKELLAKARHFSDTTRVWEPQRGEIRDRNGRTLAISVAVKAVYVNPGICSNRVDQVAQTLGPFLKIPPEAVAGRVRACLERADPSGAGAHKALLLKRNVPVTEWQGLSTALELETFGFGKPKLNAVEQATLRKLRRQLLFARDEQARVYPYGESLGQVLGFVLARTNRVGPIGLCGIERSCDRILAGKPGLCISEQDAAGNELPARRTFCKLPTDGHNVVLTVDLRVQQIVEQALAAARAKYCARAASAIVMNPATGEILASACCPGFNPQNPGASVPETWRNTVFLDMVEPGSILKFIPLAGALEEGRTRLDSGVYCEQGRFVVNKVVVHDHAPYGLLTMLQAFAKSSNIAFAKLALALGAPRFSRWLMNFGLGHCTGIPFAADAPGRIAPPQTMSTMTLTRAGFGQGLTVSQLQMAVAMCVIANNGRLMRPWLVSRIESPQGQILQQFQPQFVRQIVSPQTAQLVKEALKAVVSPEGTGALAASDQYTLPAKTGTAQKSDTNGYPVGRYYSSMIGFFPADAPRVVISVALDEPQNGYYAGTVVGPVFRSIAEQIGACLQIPPDKVQRGTGGNLLTKASTTGTQPVRPVASRAPGRNPPAGIPTIHTVAGGLARPSRAAAAPVVPASPDARMRSGLAGGKPAATAGPAGSAREALGADRTLASVSRP
jgi:cell division protein FtsI (penicillin-binding protein 3)